MTRPAPVVRCDCCSKPITYDLLVPDELWAQIAPKPVEGWKGGGLLCPDCILCRALAEEALEGVPTAKPSEPTCRLCGCTQDRACHDEERGACSWAEPDLCSHCADSASLLEELLTGTAPDGTPSDRIEALYDGAEVGEISLPVHHAEQLLAIVKYGRGNV